MVKTNQKETRLILKRNKAETRDKSETRERPDKDYRETRVRQVEADQRDQTNARKKLEADK